MRAFDYYVRAGEVKRAVAVARTWITGDHMISGLKEMLQRALELVAPDSNDAAMLLARYGRFVGVAEGDYEAARQALDRALQIVAVDKDSRLELWVLINLTTVWTYHLRVADALSGARRSIELARTLGEPHMESLGLNHAVRAMLCVGDLEGARHNARAQLALCESLGGHSRRDDGLLSCCCVSVLEGDWQAARSFLDEGRGSGPASSDGLFFRALIEYESGGPARGEPHLKSLLAPDGSTTDLRRLGRLARLARILIVDAGAAPYFQSLPDRATTFLAARGNPAHKLMVRAALGLMASLRRNPEQALGLYPALQAARGTMLCVDLLPQLAGDRLLGLLCHPMGRLDDAARHFDDALAFCRKAGYRPELAWSLCEYADALRDRNGPGDQEKAAALLDESLAISKELGMRPLMERVLSRRRILKA